MGTQFVRSEKVCYNNMYSLYFTTNSFPQYTNINSFALQILRVHLHIFFISKNFDWINIVRSALRIDDLNELCACKSEQIGENEKTGRRRKKEEGERASNNDDSVYAY